MRVEVCFRLSIMEACFFFMLFRKVFREKYRLYIKTKTEVDINTEGRGDIIAEKTRGAVDYLHGNRMSIGYFTQIVAPAILILNC